MTDEEIEKEAKEYADWFWGASPSTQRAIKQAYLDGLAEGRKEKWHDLRKNPDDLPKHSGLYCVQCGEVREYVKEEKSWFTVDFDPCMNRTEETYLWCEIPKFEE